MLSSASPPFPLHSTAASRWREVQSVYRRVCVLRASGKNEEAEVLESTKLTQAVGSLRESSPVTPDQLSGLFAAEEQRVADARALAEILLPMLMESSFALPLAASRPVTNSIATASRTPATATVDSESKSPLEDKSTGTLPGIADFIDEMLSQDRARTAPLHPVHRRRTW